MSSEGPLIVHNCGYGMGHRRFRTMLDEVYDVQVDEAFAKRAIDVYRAANPKIVAFWKLLERGFAAVVGGGMKRVKVGPVHMGTLKRDGRPWAWIDLPSGRRMWYADAVVRGGSVRYFGRNIYKGGAWEVVDTHGGKIAENITQALSRDVLAEAMLRLDAAGYQVAFTVHDEVVCEDEGQDLAEFERLMLEPLPWTAGLPLDVEVFRCGRYRK